MHSTGKSPAIACSFTPTGCGDPALLAAVQQTAEQQPNILTEPLSAYYKAVRRAVTPAFSTANLK